MPGRLRFSVFAEELPYSIQTNESLPVAAYLPQTFPWRDSINPENRNRRWVAAGVAGLLGILFLQLALSADRNSITWDEDDHIYAGYMSWRHADFGLNPEHPPLVKLLAALPLLHLPLKMPVLQDRFFKIEAFLNGKDFVFKNEADKILFRARIAASLLTLLLALLVFLATQEMFGTGAAFIALILLVFDPNLLAHGAFVGTDAGLSCFMFASIYAFYRHVKAPSLWRLVVVGFATGLALAAKHTAILVFPMLLLLAISEVVREKSTEEASKTKRTFSLAAAFIGITVIALAILWACYGFRYQARSGNLQLNPPLSQFVQQLSRPREVRLLEGVARWHLLPESYIYGLADVRIMSDFYTSYIFGKVHPHGVWFYFPAAFAIKSTLTFLILLGITAWAIAKRKLNSWREILFLTIPPAFHMLVAMWSGMNIGVRHILPVYLFLSVLIPGAAWKLIQENGRWILVVAVLLIYQAISTNRVSPAYIAYANELWGGPSNTYKYLTDSNVDWGQQLKATRAYLDQRGVKDCWFVYFAQGVVDFRDYGIPCKPLPTADTMWVNEPIDAPPAIDGTVFISAGDLSGFEFGGGPLNPYEQFRQLYPTAVIDYGVFVFDGHFEIPLAAAHSHAQKAANLLDAKQLPEALSEAQQAVALAPDAVKPNAVLGDVFAAMQRPAEARAAYGKALTLAKTIVPEFQVGWVKTLEAKLAAK
jgi:4-amino-4-deoxy-L-arabinose transferase-like glycosyltransferase